MCCYLGIYLVEDFLEEYLMESLVVKKKSGRVGGFKKKFCLCDVVE